MSASILVACTSHSSDGAAPKRCTRAAVLAVSRDVAEGRPRLFVIEGDRPEQSIHPRWLLSHPAFSPDGRRLVVSRAVTGDYESAGPGVEELWVMDRDGSNATAITHRGPEATIASWSPDGRTILFRTSDGHTSYLATVPADGSGEPTRLAQAYDHWISVAAWSPDGDRIAYSRSTMPNDPGGNDTELVLADSDGSNPQVVSRFDQKPQGIVWNRDGRSLIVSRYSAMGSIFRLERIDADGRVTDIGAGLSPQWGPGNHLYVVDAKGSLRADTLVRDRLETGAEVVDRQRATEDFAVSSELHSRC